MNQITDVEIPVNYVLAETAGWTGDDLKAIKSRIKGRAAVKSLDIMKLFEPDRFELLLKKAGYRALVAKWKENAEELITADSSWDDIRAFNTNMDRLYRNALRECAA